MEYAGWQVAVGMIFAYIILLGILGYLSFRQTRLDVEDYFLVGRAASFPILFFTVAATYHSSFALLTSAGQFYSLGLYFWAAGAWTWMTGACGYLLGVRFWYLGKKYGFMTPADLLGAYYKSEIVRTIAAVLGAVFMIPYMTVQAMGLGYITTVASAGHISYAAGVIIFLFIVLLYVMAGGLRAVYWTDFLQGIWMVVALFVAGFFLVYKLFGGVGEMFRQVAAISPAHLKVSPTMYPMWFSNFLLLSFGIVLQPHMWIRYYTARDPRTMKWLGALNPLYLTFIYVPAGLVGWSALVAVKQGMLPDIAKTFGSTDATLPAMLVKFAAPWFTGILLAGATAAAMSTADSQLHAFSAVVTVDIYRRFFKRDATAAMMVSTGRIAMVVAFVLSSLFALTKPGIIFDIVAFAGGGTLQLLPATLSAIYPWRFKLTTAGVTSGIVVGGVLTILLTKGLGDKLLGMPAGLVNPWGFHGAVIAFAINLVVTVLVSAVTPKPSQETLERFHGYLQSTEIYTQ